MSWQRRKAKTPAELLLVGPPSKWFNLDRGFTVRKSSPSCA